MRAWVLEEWGLDNLKEVDLPELKLKADEIKVAFQAASLNYRDILVAQGLYNPKFNRPLVPCSDAYGEIIEVGSALSPTLIGRKVLTLFAPNWQAGPPNRSVLKETMGGPRQGVLQEYQNLKLDELVLLDTAERYTPHEWATFPCAGVTAWNCLIEQAKLSAGHSVLFLGTGGVSLFGLQIAKLIGAKSLLLSSSPSKQQHALDMGAQAVENYKNNPKWSDWVLEQTQGQGVDVVLETGGAGTLEQSVRSAKVGGHISLIGVLGGHQKPLNILPIIMKALKIQGAVVGNRQHSQNLVRAFSESSLKPVIHKTFSWDRVPQAFQELQRGHHLGKITVSFPS